MSGRVAGKVALITGAARGQGRADALRLAGEGADVIVVDVCAPLPSDTVLFLASDESKFITAHEIAPDAGVTEF